MTPGVEVACVGEGSTRVVPGEVPAVGVGLAQLLAVLDVLGEGWVGKHGLRNGWKDGERMAPFINVLLFSFSLVC